MLAWREAKAAACFVQFRAPALEPPVRRREKGSPKFAAERCPRQQRAYRVGRRTRGGARVDVWDERRDLYSSAFSGQSRRQRENVVDDDLWVTFAYERLSLLSRLQDRLVGLQWRLTGRKDGVLRGRRKGQPVTAY